MGTYILLSSMIVLFIGTNRCDEMLGPGKWSIMNIQRCEGDYTLPTKMDASMRRVNRSHVAFSFNVHYDRDIDESVAIRVDICKYVDGGCKPYQVMADKSAINFIETYAKKNVEAGLNMVNVDAWPLPKGDYAIDNYIFNLDEMPKTAMYGDFIAKGYFLTDGVEFSCVEAAVKFEKYDDEDDEYDN